MRKLIGELLVEIGATSADEIKNALGHQRALGGVQRLGEVLVSMGKVTAEQVARALSLQFDLPFIDLPEIPASVSSLVPIEVQAEHRILPFRLEVDGKGERLHLAVADPSDLGLVDEIRFQLGKPVKIWVASASEIDDVLRALGGEAVGEVDPIEIDEDLSLPPEWDHPASPQTTPPATTSVLDELLSSPGRRHTPSRPIEVVKFPAAPKGASLEFSEEDLRILENIERMAEGGEPDLDSSRVRPAQMVASLIRLLIRKGVIQEGEFLDELARK